MNEQPSAAGGAARTNPSASAISGFGKACRKPMKTAPCCKRQISSCVGGATFTTTTASHGLPAVAPASVSC